MNNLLTREKRTTAAVVLMVVSLVVLPACGKKRSRAQVPAPMQPASAANRNASAATPPSTAVPSTAARARNRAPAVQVGYVEEGVASWYGVPYHGRPAADGEIYDMETLVAAHRVLPFNTWLRVTNLANSKTVTVRVIDRGPFIAGRLIDLSKAAARQIDLIGPGTGQVRLEVISAPADVPSNDFYAVQAGAFSVYANAERARDSYAATYGTAQLAVKQGPVPLWRVLVGKEPSPEAAQELARRLSERNKSVFVVRLDQTEPTKASAPANSVDQSNPPPPRSNP